MLSEQDQQFLKKHRAKIIFAVIFVVFGILLMTLHFLKTMFIVLLAVAGWYFGRIVDDKDFLRKFLNNYLGK